MQAEAAEDEAAGEGEERGEVSEEEDLPGEAGWEGVRPGAAAALLGVPAWQGRQAACHPLSGARRIAARAVPPCARQAANAYLRSHSEAQAGVALCVGSG